MNTNAERAAQFGIAASRKWWSAARELAVSFDRQSLENAIVSWIKLNKRDEVASRAPSVDFYLSLMNEAFLRLYDAETINPIFPVTDLGQVFIDQTRRMTGIGSESLPTPKPTLTPEQELEATVRSDWKNLPSKRIKEKMSGNKLYRQAFEKLSGDLESNVTTQIQIGG
jgi:hypothetical protein